MTTILMLKSFKRLNSLKKSINFTSNHKISYLLTKLTERQVIGVKGIDSYEYIQGLVTNDIRHLCPTRETSVCSDCINSFMLNTTGRVITDLFIYKYDNDFEDKNIKHLLLEMDSKISQKMTQFLNHHRIRRKVNIEVRNDLEVWSVFPSVDHFDEQTFKQITENDINFDDLKSEEVVVVRDPRLKQMGFRFLVNNRENNRSKEKIETILRSKSIEFDETDAEDYHKFRYRLGVGEGIKDFPIESCFPLECNGDFLHAISFHKGCYVGQELTARIYHTGVIRKRLMSIEIIDGNNSLENIEIQNIVTNDGKNVGKFRSNSGVYGLALLKVEECLKCDTFKLNDIGLTLKASKPFWWPKELSKESVPAQKVDQT